MASTALVLGAAAALLGTPDAPVVGRLDVDQIARIVAHEQDHVDAIELAQWIRDRKTGLRVVSVRDTADAPAAAYVIPGAEALTLEQIAHNEFASADTLVLYSDAGAHAAQAWMMLRARGITNAYFLRGGLAEWLDDVIDPVLPDDASEAERRAFAPIADISRYFDGTPHVGPRGARAATSLADRIAAMKKRGC